MSDRISQAEAERLLNLIKHTLVERITFPLKSETEDFEVAGDDMKDIFIVHIYHGRLNRLKSYYSARVKFKNILLLELHIGQTNVHHNPDGEKIVGNHWHIYTEQYDCKTAFPAENIISDEFIENTIKFLDKFNVLKKPDINFQEEL